MPKGFFKYSQEDRDLVFQEEGQKRADPVLLQIQPGPSEPATPGDAADRSVSDISLHIDVAPLSEGSQSREISEVSIGPKRKRGKYQFP